MDIIRGGVIRGGSLEDLEVEWTRLRKEKGRMIYCEYMSEAAAAIAQRVLGQFV